MGTIIALVVLFIMNIFTFIYTLHISQKINKGGSTNKEPIKKLKRGLIHDNKVNRDNNEKIPYTLEVSIIEESNTKYKIQIDNIIFNSSSHFKHKKTIIDMDNNRWILKKDVELIVESKAVVRKEKMSKLLEDDKE